MGEARFDSQEDPTLPDAGAELGHFRIVGRLGSGGMGQVFSARPREGGELVALKQISIIDPTLLYRFKQEFRSLADLSHPNLVKLHELFVLPTGLAFFTMELVEGESLLRWVRRRTPAGTAPNFQRLFHALRQLAAGALHLHQTGRVHRDLKPSNVLITPEGRLVILDFGLVFEVSGRDARITATGQFVGTPAYMAPEQGQRGSVGAAVDLYAMGVILFECLTGSMPFVGSAVRVLVNKQQAAAPDPRELTLGIPDWLAQLCRALLEPNPDRRATIEQVLAALAEHGEATLQAAVREHEREPELVGREAESSVLEQAYATQVREAGVTLVRLTGRPGRGKSALIERFLQSIHEIDEGVVLRGRCHPRESVPYEGIDGVIDALTLHLRTLPAIEAAKLQPRHLRELCELFPVLTGVWSEPARRTVERDPVSRRRLGIAALRELLARIADASTLVIVIDDFHWSDLDGLGVLSELLLPPEPPSMLLLLAYDPESKGPVIGPIADPDTLRSTRSIELALAPLDPAASLAMAHTLVRAGTAAELDLAAQQLARESAGEPLALIRAARASRQPSGPPITDHELLRSIRALEPDPRSLLEVAALAGVPLPTELVQTELLSEAVNFSTAARVLVDAGLLAALALEQPGVLEIRSARISELVRIEFDQDRQVALHGRLAEVLGAHDFDPELVARHFELAGDHEHARACVAGAARVAADALAFVRAERLYRRALELLVASSAEPPPSERLDLMLALADQLSHLARCPEAAELYVAVANHSSPELAAQLRLRAATQYAISGWTEFALPLLQELMRNAGERLPNSIFGSLALFGWNQLRLLIHGRRIRTRDPGDVSPELLARFDLIYATHTALTRGLALRGLGLGPRMVHLALAAGDPSRLVLALAIEASVYATLGLLPRSRKISAEIHRIAQPLGDPLLLGFAYATEQFQLSTEMSAVDEAIDRFEKAVSCLERSPGESWIRAPLVHRHTLVLRRSGHYVDLLAALPGWIAQFHAEGQRQYEITLTGEEVLARAEIGDLESGRRCLERGRAGWQVQHYSFVDFLLDNAEAWLLMAEGRLGEALQRARAGQAALHHHGLGLWKGPRFRVREICLYAELARAIALDDPRMAPRTRDLRRLRRCGLENFAATAMLLAAGRASLLREHERERELWRQGLAECEALNFRGLAAAARWRLAELGVEDHAELHARAQAYFDAQGIQAIQHFVDLMTPARRPTGRIIER